MVKKAQAAMEFLMTYGWAILVVLVVIGALAYFGVLSPSTLLPEKCTFPVSVNCIDHTVTASSVQLILLNGAGRDMKINDAGIMSEALQASATGTAYTCSLKVSEKGQTLRNGQRTTLTLDNSLVATGCNYNPTGRDKNRYAINISYSWLDSQTTVHTLPGELLARGP